MAEGRRALRALADAARVALAPGAGGGLDPRWSLALAVVSTAGALGLRLALARWVAPPYLLFFPAVLITALGGGLGPGLLAAGLSAVSVARWVLPAERGPGPLSGREEASLAVFLVLAALLSVVLDRFRASRLQAERDLAERRRAEEDLRVNQRRLDLALRAGRLGLWDLDLATDQAWRTQEHDRIFGYPELQPTWTVADAQRHVVPEDRARFEQAFREAFATGRFLYQLRIRPPGGPVRWIFAQGEVLRDDQGAPRRMMGTVEDVTARVEAEAALEESRRRLALFIRHAPAAIAMLDRELRYLAASERYLADYGLGDREVVGRGHYELFPEIPQHWKDIHQRCLRGAVERCDEDAFPRADGRTDWVRWEIRPWLDAAGEVGGLILFSEVITGRKALEAEVSRAERLRAVATLVRGMSHEINNPLAAVVSNLEFLRAQLLAPADRGLQERPGEVGAPELREALEDAEAGAARIREIVRALATCVQPAGDASRRGRPAAAAERALELARRELQGCAEVRLELPPLPEVPVADEDLSAVLLSLLRNAGQATAQDRPNRVRVSGALLPGERVALSVADTGVGMEPAVLAHVFEPFFTTRAVGRGRGLGLAVCRGLVDAAGGTLTCASTVGVGSTVTVELPVAAPA